MVRMVDRKLCNLFAVEFDIEMNLNEADLKSYHSLYLSQNCAAKKKKKKKIFHFCSLNLGSGLGDHLPTSIILVLPVSMYV